jgi:DNA replication protein DnaC
VKHVWCKFAEKSDKEGWPAARLLMALAEHEIAERDRRRIERHLAEARLLPGKTLESVDFDTVPMISKAHVAALCAGDSWLGKGANLILIGPPGGGKSHLSSAIGLALLEKATGCCSAAPQTSCRSCRLPVANSHWKRPSNAWSASTC